jgi:glycogen debranching enzyme GlgX
VLDPYAKAIGRDLHWDDALYGYPHGTGNDAGFDERDSAPFSPLACVVEPAFSWGEDRPPRTPWHETVVYEAHVKGFTRQHPRVPDHMRGTYAGLASAAAIRRLRELGVTAVELLPIHYHLNDRFLVGRGLTNYWGYNTLGFFAPDPRYAASDPAGAVPEFKSMVRTLHAAGLEVILDVVYNHTAEGDHLGPTLSLRAVDNAAYYRLAAGGRRYLDFTGCGNSLNVSHPAVLKLIMDSRTPVTGELARPAGIRPFSAGWFGGGPATPPRRGKSSYRRPNCDFALVRSTSTLIACRSMPAKRVRSNTLLPSSRCSPHHAADRRYPPHGLRASQRVTAGPQSLPPF